MGTCEPGGVKVADYWEFSMQLKERGQGESRDVTSNHVSWISNNLSPIVGNIYERGLPAQGTVSHFIETKMWFSFNL